MLKMTPLAVNQPTCVHRIFDIFPKTFDRTTMAPTVEPVRLPMPKPSKNLWVRVENSTVYASFLRRISDSNMSNIRRRGVVIYSIGIGKTSNIRCYSTDGKKKMHMSNNRQGSVEFLTWKPSDFGLNFCCE